MTHSLEVDRDRSAATKAAILEAAGRLFVENGYDATGLRDIAAAARVNQALIIRHYGSKEAVFLQAMAVPDDLAALSAVPRAELGRELARVVIEPPHRNIAVWAALLGASSRSEVRARLETILTQTLVPGIVKRIAPGVDLDARARVLCIQFLGLVTAMSIRVDAGLTDEATDEVIALYGDAMQRLIDGPGDAPAHRF